MPSTAPARRRPVRPREDHGFFGPGSIVWQLWGYPTSVTVGFQRSVVIEELDPFLLAAVAGTDKVRYAPAARYDNTLVYFATMALGDSRSAIEASEILYRVHGAVTGTEPVSGLPYSPNDPETQLWIHVTAWHSIQYTYETFGPGRITETEDQQWWAACRVAAELQTIDVERVPSSRAEASAYLQEVRARLCVTEETRAMMLHLLEAATMIGPRTPVLRLPSSIAGRIVRRATISTFPRWMRDLTGIRQTRLTDALVWVLYSVAMRAAAPMPVRTRLLRIVSPATAAVALPALRHDEVLDPVVVTPAEARERWGRLAAPAELQRQAAGSAAPAAPTSVPVSV
ncbi:hypothetical protein HMPREF0063_12711 [Aeromicrobium marinum DSM 15272]|uniref:ER-bound oxygenase mpaB/mpaB'/Rubber oxygenase catalytic domain-containing protein n=1 Tax=Aeromicrobium marinum DSM 15272 TaxID=585531 RepID=E2SFA2_9ACTN|nr:oxygenase MpaB family protein [Aeromicrobium marinum]EFQ82187.1 hypothetical protein HMPREF0063_12711 [Aeromicrobium marinum DSM 15272]